MGICDILERGVCAYSADGGLLGGVLLGLDIVRGRRNGCKLCGACVLMENGSLIYESRGSKKGCIMIKQGLGWGESGWVMCVVSIP